MVIDRQKIVVLLLVAGVVVVGLLADRFHVTETERIERVVRDMATAVERMDCDALLAHISDDYDDGGVTREDLRKVAENFFATYGPVEVGRPAVGTSVSGDLATAVVEVQAYLPGVERRGRSVWEVDLARGPDAVWRVTRLELVRAGSREWEGRHWVRSLLGR